MEDSEPSGKFGEYKAVVKEPDFELLEVEVEWKVLPQELMDSILRLPDQLATLKRQVEALEAFSSGTDITTISMPDGSALLHLASVLWTKLFG